MRKLKGIWLIVLCCLLCVSAFAAEPSALERKGSITLTLETEAGPVPGGTLSVYPVAKIEPVSQGYSYTYVDAFMDCPYSLEGDLLSQVLANHLITYARYHQLQPLLFEVDLSGTVETGELDCGLYLVFQEDSHVYNGYLPIQPFLISIPVETATGEWVFDANATPKVSVEKEDPTPAPTSTPKPDKPVPTPGATPKPGGSGDDIPDTGQSNWPVPILAIAGIVLFGIGWYIRYSGKDDGLET